MLKGKSLLDYTNLFSPNEYEKNDKIILTVILKMKKYIVLYVVSIKNLKNLNIIPLRKNTSSLYYL